MLKIQGNFQFMLFSIEGAQHNLFSLFYARIYYLPFKVTRTINQWWNDRRNGVQWYTFWVAVLVLILTIVFGMAQTVEGALQVYKAYHPTLN